MIKDAHREEAKAAYDRVCAAVGHAASCWSDVESELSRIYAIAIKSSDMATAIESFYAVIGFDSKVRMTDIAMQALCRSHPETSEVWNNLVNRTKRQSKIRNKLAHGKVMCLGKPVKNIDEFGPLAGCWFIAYYGMLRTKQGVFAIGKKGIDAQEKLTADEILKIAERFTALAGDLQHLFLDELVGITSGKKK